MIAFAAVLRGLARASWVLLLSRPASAMLFADVSVTRGEQAVDCPNAVALTERVERIRNGAVRATGESREIVRVRVDFTRAAEVYAARLTFSGAKRGERKLMDSGASCEGLAQAVSVAIALALDRNEDDAEESPASAPATEAARTTAPRPSQSSASSVILREAPSPHRLELGALFEGGAGVEFGSALAWSAAARAQALYGKFSFELGAHAILPSTAQAGAGRVRTSWLFGEASVCRFWGERFTLGPCALFAAGRIRGEGAGYDAVRAAELTWLAAAAGLVLRGPVAGPVYWGLSGTLWVPLRKLTFSVENGGVVWESSATSGVIAAGAGFRFH